MFSHGTWQRMRFLPCVCTKPRLLIGQEGLHADRTSKTVRSGKIRWLKPRRHLIHTRPPPLSLLLSSSTYLPRTPSPPRSVPSLSVLPLTTACTASRTVPLSLLARRPASTRVCRPASTARASSPRAPLLQRWPPRAFRLEAAAPRSSKRRAPPRCPETGTACCEPPTEGKRAIGAARTG